MSKILIVSGGNVDKEFINRYLEMAGKWDAIIAADKGLEMLDELEILPDHIVGDLDSVSREILSKYEGRSQIHRYDSEKDYTDTDIALKLAIELGAKEVIIFGAVGTRFDHNISNIQTMKAALENNVDCKIVDFNNEIRLIDKATTIIRKANDYFDYKFVSLLPLTTAVRGITLRGFKYLLENKTLAIGESIGVSNEQVEQEATIDLEEGILMVIRSKD
ncbi:MAG: thiamine diphosphokinase [Oscillospiraceae bacterium]|nr:thiamine diphosphokinase [Oscillospiraceae bacterium]